ncbi:uncharacterized protein BP5553_04807 [Venustampulla echinocandica]|uniref:Protein kinase domain-containing protein n=1 Tax=Venustampulla echinocandica TaxID=2656787 RepID=A0A370TPD0_9HELO|nr:uncharacterized protein BP5553_04807 [Venustampulla echinocandica]RDL37374.1 hypothetical protein BP5553_04807 [Venustampulla echinocandica]
MAVESCCLPKRSAPSTVLQVTLVPWDPDSEHHVRRLILQRIACGWHQEFVEGEWSKLQRQGHKSLQWIVLSDADPATKAELLKRHIDAFPEEGSPLIDSAHSLGGKVRKDSDHLAGSFIPVGHISLDGDGADPAGPLSYGLKDVYRIANFYASWELQSTGLGRAAMDALENMAVAEPLFAKTLALCAISDETDQDEERNTALGRPKTGVLISLGAASFYRLYPIPTAGAVCTIRSYSLGTASRCFYRSHPTSSTAQEIQEGQGLSELGEDSVHLKAQLQSVHPSKVKICSENPDDQPDIHDPQPQRVCVDDQILFFKSADRSSPRDTINAIKKYLRIADLGPDIRTSQLYGIIVDDKNPLIGLLFHYVEEESTLAFAVEPRTPATLRQQWLTQITDTLMRLHRAGVVWGDAKPDNVLIDEHSNAWIIDFEGGYTHGWVYRDKEGTVEGDLQGLANIVNFIFEKTGSEHSADDEYSHR